MEVVNSKSVNQFYNYVTGNTGTGPKGTAYQVDKTPSTFNLGYISYGDVIQGFPDWYSEYYHSIYTSAVYKPGSLPDIVYCAHTNNRLDYPLSKFFEWVGPSGKLRGISFKSTTFDN